MATDAGPYYLGNGEMIFYFGWYSESTGEMLELSKSPYARLYNQYADMTFFSTSLGPGFTQKWGALGYFIRPEYLDRFSRYRPQTLNEGNIPVGEGFDRPRY